MKMERLNAELEKAKQKAAEWQARARDIQRQITEKENLEIVRAVREIHVSPEELKDILAGIQSAKGLPEQNQIKEERKENEENEE